MRFDQLLYNDDLLDALEDMRFSECTPIQEKAIPVVEQGHDLIALAQTGTGKTAAYLLPIIDLIADGGFPDDAVTCVVMAPTRELAMQIDQQMQGFGYFLPQISSMAIYGGTDGKTFDAQKNAIRRGADIVIATPGRLLAHMQMGYVDLSRVSFFVLDEADRMLDMGFYEDISKIMSVLPADVQSLLFSATLSPKIKQLATKLLKDPVEVKIAVAAPPEKIDQQAILVQEAEKEAKLHEILQSIEIDKIIVFSSSKATTKQLARAVKSWHYDVGQIHSDLEQSQRDETMLGFRAGRIKILVATDIVARGIDVDDISTIINYDVPHDPEDYVHRIGRTARAEASGRAITLVTPRERRKFGRIESLIKKRLLDSPNESRGKKDRPSATHKKKPQKTSVKSDDNAKEAKSAIDTAGKSSQKKRRWKHRKPAKKSVVTDTQK